jgi:lipopolysaccharide/colanic/teichoic acid biosynthesis glycosyltransferase
MNRPPSRRLRQAFYRLFDVTCAAAGLLLLMPLLAALAVFILWNDGLPILFSQTRVGRKASHSASGNFERCAQAAGAAPSAAAGDAAFTRAGAVLRRCKLDELPQLFNVLKGDMSLVGPRPEAPEYVQLEAPIWQAVLQVRPGVTDLASLLYRDEEKLLGASSDPNALYREKVLPAKLVLNLMYLRSRSLRLDLKLILLSIRYSLFPGQFDPDLIMRTPGFEVLIGVLK